MPLLGVLIIAGVWKIGAAAAGAEVILPGPLVALKALGTVLGSPSFLPALQATALRGFAAFLISAFLGLLLGVLAGLYDDIRNLLRPLVITIKSTPVMSFILLALIWFPSGFVPVFVAILMAFPIIYENVAAGLRSVDPKLIQMARVYRVDRPRIISTILLPGLFAFFFAGAKTALGIIWKAVIAAEILSRPDAAVGSAMYEAKIYIETASVIAWTLIAVLLSGASELLLQRTARLFRGVRRGGGTL
jgi:NitT/TauT family transport system permease protein